MSKAYRKQRWWAWIMGAITLGVALFAPSLWWRSPHAQGFFWQLRDQHLTTPPLTAFSGLVYFVFFVLPPGALTVCIIWLWSLQMNWDPTSLRALLVTLEAAGLALLINVVALGVLFFRPGSPGFGWGMAFLLYGIMFASQAFLSFLPWLLLAAIALGLLQRKYQASQLKGGRG